MSDRISDKRPEQTQYLDQRGVTRVDKNQVASVGRATRAEADAFTTEGLRQLYTTAKLTVRESYEKFMKDEQLRKLMFMLAEIRLAVILEIFANIVVGSKRKKKDTAAKENLSDVQSSVNDISSKIDQLKDLSNEQLQLLLQKDPQLKEDFDKVKAFGEDYADAIIRLAKAGTFIDFMRESGLANAPDELKQVTLAMCLFNQVSKEIDLMNKLSLILDQLETMPAADEDKLQQELALLKKKNQEIADLRRELADPHRHPSLTHSERIKIERNLVNLLENKDYKKLDDTVNAFLLIERDQVRAELDKRDERSDIQAVIAFIASNSPDKADMAINISEAMRAKGQPLPSLEGLMGTVPIAQSSGIDDSFKDLWMKIKSE